MNLADCVTGLQHIGIPTNDMRATEAFYAGLGFEAVLRAQNGPESVVFLRLQNVVIEAYQNGRAIGSAGALDHLALDVRDIEAAFSQVTRLGHRPLEGEIRFLPFWERGVRYFTIAGPNGEKVEFSQRL